MRHIIAKCMIIIGLAAAGLILNGQIWPVSNTTSMVTSAEAVVGAPATPVSYAGVARRSTVDAGAPGVGVAPGVGAGAPGVGVAPGVSPVNRGGPVNRVGRR